MALTFGNISFTANPDHSVSMHLNNASYPLSKSDLFELIEWLKAIQYRPQHMYSDNPVANTMPTDMVQPTGLGGREHY